MSSTILYYDAVQKFLEKGGYKLGFECISDDMMNLLVCSYWYSGRNVVLVKHHERIVMCVRFCNSEEDISSYGSKREAMAYTIERKLKNPCDAPPTILGTFDDVLFKSYESNIDKYETLMQSTKQFSPEFLELFKNEINRMTSNETSVATAVRRWQWFQDNQGKYYYATDVIGNTACLKKIGDVTGEKKLDFRELQNRYKMIETPVAIGQLLQMVLTGCHEIFNVQELVPILQALGHGNLEEFSRIEKPVVFNGEEYLDCHSNENAIFETDIIFSCGNFTLRISAGIDLFFQLTNDTECSITGRIQSICEAIKPYSFYKIVRDLVCNILEHFNMILWGQSHLHAYLYQLLGALESVEPSKDIPYEATWDEYPVVDNTISTARDQLGLTEAQPTKIQF